MFVKTKVRSAWTYLKRKDMTFTCWHQSDTECVSCALLRVSWNTCLNGAFNVHPNSPNPGHGLFLKPEWWLTPLSVKKKTDPACRRRGPSGGWEAGGDEHRRWTQLDAHFNGPPHPGEGPPCSQWLTLIWGKEEEHSNVCYETTPQIRTAGNKLGR